MARVILIIFLAVFSARQAECGVLDKIYGWISGISFNPNDPNFIQDKVRECSTEYKDAISKVENNLNELTQLFEKVYKEDRFTIQWNEIPNISQKQAESCRNLISKDSEKNARAHYSKLKQDFETLESRSGDELEEPTIELLKLMEDIIVNDAGLTAKWEAYNKYSEMCKITKRYSTEYADLVKSSESLLENYLPTKDCLKYLQ